MERVYIAHPYGGKEENKQKVEEIIRKLVKDNPDMMPVSPIHALGFLYNETEYIAGMNLCLKLLQSCDKLVLCPGWQGSKGCCMEYAFAQGHGIEIFLYGEDANE